MKKKEILIRLASLMLFCAANVLLMNFLKPTQTINILVGLTVGMLSQLCIPSKWLV